MGFIISWLTTVAPYFKSHLPQDYTYWISLESALDYCLHHCDTLEQCWQQHRFVYEPITSQFRSLHPSVLILALFIILFLAMFGIVEIVDMFMQIIYLLFHFITTSIGTFKGLIHAGIIIVRLCFAKKARPHRPLPPPRHLNGLRRRDSK
jgi:hypothetical protein